MNAVVEKVDMPEAMDEERLARIVKNEFANSMGRPGGDISKEREKAWERYRRMPLGNEVEGESELVTSDVSDVVDGIMPSLLRMFTTADNVCNFDAVGPEDEASSQQQSDYVNHVFFKENDSFLILFFWMFDALLQKLGIIMAYWDESEEVTTENYKRVRDEALADLMEDPELEGVSQSEPYEIVTGIDPIQGMVKEMVRDMEFRRVKKRGRITVENVPPEEYRVSTDARSPKPGRIRMRGRERLMSRSDMVEMGFEEKQVYKLKGVDLSSDNNTEAQTKRTTSDEQEDSSIDDRSQEMIMVREAYIRVDYDGDGRAELRQVFTGNEELLRWEETGEAANTPVDRDPFHVITPHPLPHKHFGEATAEKAIDIMEASTTLLRQVMMNLYHTNNPGHGVDENAMGENTLDDLLGRRIGSVTRFDGLPAQSYQAMTVPFTANASFPMMEYFDKVKRDRTGVSSDGEGLSPDALKNIQTSVLAQSIDMSKMKIEAVARIFAETGFKTLFLHIHELALKHEDKLKMVNLRNKWVPVNPTEWTNRQNMTVNIGLGVGTREQNMLHLDAIWDKQMQMATGGGLNLTVTPQNMYHTAAEYVKNANRKQPELFFTDPGDKPAPTPPDEQQELERMQAEQEQRRQQLDADRNQINQQKVALNAQEAELKHQRELMKLEDKAREHEDRMNAELLKLREENPKLHAEIDRIIAETRFKDAEARAQEIENDLVESGVIDLIDGENGSSEGS